MTITENLTSGVLPEEVQAGPDTIMTLVFFGVVAGTMTTLLSGTFWAWRKEHQEKKKAGVTVIPQQSVHRCPQHYLLMLYTGSGGHSSTTANVFCRIYGNHHKTKPIILRDPDRPMFQSSSVSSFLVPLSRSLDQIQEIHIWHDISGPDPPWYLESVVICHLNTDVTWYFEANRWLDVSTGLKEVECKLQPLQRRTFLGSKTLFDAKFNDNLKNKHLWFSPLVPSNRRTLDKFQKMSCCLAVTGMMALIATILVEKTQTMFSNALIRFGPWRLKLDDICRAVLCSTIAFVVRLLLEYLFLNCKRSRTLDVGERNVEEHIQDNFLKLNAITFVEENTAEDKTECSLNSHDETKSSEANTCSKDIELLRSKELQIEMQGEAYLHKNISAEAITYNGNIRGEEIELTRSLQLEMQGEAYLHRNVSDETITSESNICGEEIELTRSLQLEMQGEAYLQETISSKTSDNVGKCVSDTSSSESESDNHSSQKAQNLAELFAVLGNLLEKDELMQILDNGNNDYVNVDYSLAQVKGIETISNSENVLSLDDVVLGEVVLGDLPSDSNTDNENVEYRQESVSRTATVTSPVEIPKLWKHLPFPRHLLDDHSIKKLHSDTPKLPEIFLRFIQAQCFILPLICTAIVLVIGVQWPVAMAESWLTTFVIAVVCEIFVLETLYIFVHALYFAKWHKRPVKEEDLINELSNKVWINEEQETTYYADEVTDGAEEEEVPKPPSQEDIQKAQETAGKRRELEDVLKMLFFDVLFLVLLIFISFGNRDASSYPTRVGIEKSFNISKSFYVVTNTETFWKWLINDTIPVLLFDPFDKTPNNGRHHFLTDGYSYLLGTAILRQQRIQPGLSCQIADVAKEFFSDCHSVALTSSNEDQNDYNQGWKKEGVSKENDSWKYMSGKKSNTDYTTWSRTSSFTGGGYIAPLTIERQTTLKLVDSLNEQGWVDHLTKVVFLEFSIYNANVNILSALVFSVEFTTFGGALPRFDMYSFRLYRYYTTFQLVYLVCEVIFVVFVIQLIRRVGHQIHRDRWSYFISFWNYLDLLLIIFSLVIIALYAVRWIHLSNAIEAIRENPNTFYNFFTVALYDEFIAYLSCLIFIIPSLQFLKFLKFNKNFMVFYATLERTRKDACGFAFMFLVSLLCYSYVAYIMLNTVKEAFSTFGVTFNSMIAMLLGKFSFRFLAPRQITTSATLGPLFTYAFTGTNLFLLLNIILTIITLGFKEAQKDERFRQSEYEIVKFIVHSVKDYFGLLPTYIPPPPQIAPPVKEKHYTYFQWKLCTRYVTHSQFPRIIKFANNSYLEDFVDDLEMLADLLSLPMPRKALEEVVHEEQSF